MQISKRDIGYTVYSRVEEALREWVSDKLLLFGEQWRTHIPDGIWAKAEDKNSLLIRDEINEPLDLLEETDIPDIAEIVCYRNNFSTFIHGDEHTPQRFRERIGTLYKLRCQIAHVRQSFSSIDLDLLLEIAKQFDNVVVAGETFTLTTGVDEFIKLAKFIYKADPVTSLAMSGIKSMNSSARSSIRLFLCG